MTPTHTARDIDAARTLFARTARDIRLAPDDAPRVRGAIAELAAIRDGLTGRERRQVDIYLALLEEECADHPAAAASPRLDEARRVARDALRQDRPPMRRLAAARTALARLAALARAAPDRGERSAIARLAEPVILLQSMLEGRRAG